MTFDEIAAMRARIQFTPADDDRRILVEALVDAMLENQRLRKSIEDAIGGLAILSKHLELKR